MRWKLDRGFCHLPSHETVFNKDKILFFAVVQKASGQEELAEGLPARKR